MDNALKEIKKFVVEKDKIINNIKIIKDKCKVSVYGVIKCDGYGMGLLFMAQTLKECGINRFAISNLDDLIALRKNGFKNEEILMLFSSCLKEELEVIVKEDAVATIGSMESAILLNEIAAKENKKVNAHIKIDTGMGRYGFLYNDIDNILKVYNDFNNINIIGIYSHFNCAYCNVKKTKKQLNRFNTLIKILKDKNIFLGTVHMANSSALFKYDNCYFDAVRIGSALIGRISNGSKYGLKKVGYLEGEVREIRWLPPYCDIGYGNKFKTKWSTRIAIIPIGINDGFGTIKKYDTYRIRDCIKYICSILKRGVVNKKTYIEINNEKVQVLGQIGQNSVVVDITGLGIEIGDKCKLNINPLYVNKNILKEYVL